MRSKLAEDLRREQRERFARMTPEERVLMAERLADEWIAQYMTAHRVDRSAAMKELRRSRQAGRRPSVSMDGRDDS
jgi:hypothetical protein